MKAGIKIKMDVKQPINPGHKLARLSLALLSSIVFVMWGGQSFGTGTALAQATVAATAQATRIPILPSTPVCTAPTTVTPAVTEGPFYKAGSPERALLLDPGFKGTEIIVTGYVLTPDCKPVAHAWLDFWQADSSGTYDNTGYTLRGHQFTDEAGRYYLDTVLPGEYPGRTLHIHVKVQAANGPILTTQLFFPAATGNQRDSIFDPKLLVSVLQPGTSSATTLTPMPTQVATAAVGDAKLTTYTFNFVIPK